MRYAILISLSIRLILISCSASAAIYRFVDERGVIHFTNCPKDSRYKLFLRGREYETDEDEVLASSFSSKVDKDSKAYKKDPRHYDHLILECSQKYEVDFALIKAIIKAESSFNPQAVSKKGAKGLMQLMPETAQRMKVSDAFNPKDNIEGGVRYVKYLLSLFDNDLKLSLAAYNAGENLVSQLRSIPPYKETLNYVNKVLNFYHSYKN